MFSNCLYVWAIFVNVISQQSFEGFSSNVTHMSTLTQDELIRFWSSKAKGLQISGNVCIILPPTTQPNKNLPYLESTSAGPGNLYCFLNYVEQCEFFK